MHSMRTEMGMGARPVDLLMNTLQSTSILDAGDHKRMNRENCLLRCARLIASCSDAAC